MRKVMNACASLLISSTPALAQYRLPPPEDWITDCIANADSPEGQRPYRILHNPIPTHAANTRYCVDQYSQLTERQRVIFVRGAHR